MNKRHCCISTPITDLSLSICRKNNSSFTYSVLVPLKLLSGAGDRNFCVAKFPICFMLETILCLELKGKVTDSDASFGIYTVTCPRKTAYLSHKTGVHVTKGP